MTCGTSLRRSTLQVKSRASASRSGAEEELADVCFHLVADASDSMDVLACWVFDAPVFGRNEDGRVDVRAAPMNCLSALWTRGRRFLDLDVLAGHQIDHAVGDVGRAVGDAL